MNQILVGEKREAARRLPEVQNPHGQEEGSEALHRGFEVPERS